MTLWPNYKVLKDAFNRLEQIVETSDYAVKDRFLQTLAEAHALYESKEDRREEIAPMLDRITADQKELVAHADLKAAIKKAQAMLTNPTIRQAGFCGCHSRGTGCLRFAGRERHVGRDEGTPHGTGTVL